MNHFELKDTLIEDIEDLLIKVEQSFNIKFVGDELVNIFTFGELCDHIANKVKLEQVDDCTSQQAFLNCGRRFPIHLIWIPNPLLFTYR